MIGGPLPSLAIQTIRMFALAAWYGLRPEPFYIGIVYSVVGLLLSAFLVRDTRGHAWLEAHMPGAAEQLSTPSWARVFAETSWRNKTLFSVSQAGLVNNLNDGMSWGVFPLLFVANGVSLEGVGLIKAIYPVIWGAGQILAGSLADRVGRKPLIVWGMAVQAGGHAVIGLGLAAPLLAGSLAPSCSALARQWCTPRYWWPSAMWLTRHGALRRWASIDSGVISDTRWAR